MNSLIFSTTISGSRTFEQIDPIKTFSLGGYISTAFLNVFSGKNISYYSGSPISQIAIISEYHGGSYFYNITLPNNGYLGTGDDITYSSLVPDYKT
jgi:hypothetical protein